MLRFSTEPYNIKYKNKNANLYPINVKISKKVNFNKLYVLKLSFVIIKEIFFSFDANQPRTSTKLSGEMWSKIQRSSKHRAKTEIHPPKYSNNKSIKRKYFNTLPGQDIWMLIEKR